MYSEYISKFDNSLKVLNETMKRNQVFFELVKEFEVSAVALLAGISEMGGAVWWERGWGGGG